MDELEQLKETYFEDCRELLGDLEGHLNGLADDAGRGGALDAAFRAIHSIKGNGGIFGFRHVPPSGAGLSSRRGVRGCPDGRRRLGI